MNLIRLPTSAIHFKPFDESIKNIVLFLIEDYKEVISISLADGCKR